MLTQPSHRDELCLLVEDQIESQKMLQKAIAQTFPGMTIKTCERVGEARSWIESREWERMGLNLSFSLIDLGLPDGSGVDLMRLLKRQEPHCPSVVVTIFTEDFYLFEALAAGAFGYVLKNEGEAHIAESLRRMARDEPPMSPAIARRLMSHFRLASIESDKKVALTPREKQTLTLLVRGLTIPESAAHLGLSAQTVSGYVKIIYQKLQVSNRAEATREAIRYGLVALG